MALKNAAVVTSHWLKQQISSAKNLRVFDSTWRFSKGGYEDYLEKHIPDAGFFDLNKCCTPTQHIPRALPDLRCFEEYAQQLGINQDDHLIIYDQVGTLPSARTWWQFRLLGHSKVSVLDGGLANWEQYGYPVSDEETTSEREGNFKVKLQPELMRTFNDIRVDAHNRYYQILDARSLKYFSGEGEEPSPPTQTALETSELKEATQMCRGHLPGAISFRTELIVDPETGLFYSPEEIKENFHRAGVDLNKPLITMCYNGLAACLLSLGAALAGKDDSAGSWTEYGQRARQSDCVYSDDLSRHSG